jgi:DNA-binding MarR family transcriptional regulator
VALRVAAAMERLASTENRVGRDLSTRHGLTLLQSRILRTLNAGPPPPPRTGDLARELDVQAPTVTDAIATLRGKGLVDGVVYAGDRRAQRWSLTDVGRSMAADISRPDNVTAEAVSRLPTNLQEAMLDGLLAMILHLHELGIITVARTCVTCRHFRTTPAGHRCELLELPLPIADLRVNCPEHG